MTQVEEEHDELRGALRRTLESEPETAGRIVLLLWPFWRRRGRYAEARVWLDRAIHAAGAMPPRIESPCGPPPGSVAFLQCDYEQATEHLVEARRLYALLDDLDGQRAVLQRLGCIARERGDYEQARRLHERCLAISKESGDALAWPGRSTSWPSSPGSRATRVRRSASPSRR